MKNPRIWRVIVIILVVIAGFLMYRYFYQTPYQKSIQSFDVNMNVQKNSEILVTETIVYDFGNVDKKGIVRRIPLASVNASRLNIIVLSVVDEFNKPYKYDAFVAGDVLSVTIGDPDNLIHGIKTYKINYKVENGVAAFNNFNEIHWNATGDQWQVPIKNASVSVILPGRPGIMKMNCFTGPRGSMERNCTYFSSETNELTNVKYAITRPLMSNNGFTILLDFLFDNK